jgi:3-hydroxyacyl-CoA dehydrogenase
MTLNDRLENVAVLGAGGKMGSGISLLLAQEMTLQKLQPENQQRRYRLTLMDVNPEALEGLQKYLKKQGAKFAQKNVEKLQSFFPKADTPEAVGEEFVGHLEAILKPVTDLAAVKNSHLVFEAILEKLDLKVSVFNRLKNNCPENAYFFTNTSSIPIHELDEKVGLDGRIIGFHFYNPPAVQRLVELIIPKNIQPELPELSRELGRRLRKIIIPSNDVAGFIGNGHFMRDGLHGISEAERLSREIGFVSAVYTINRISQDFLIRPMGIFQLIDYVGLDIFRSILNIMDPHFPKETLHSHLIDKLVANGLKGGQFSDGSQKDGFLKYEEGRPAGVYDLSSGTYQLFSEGSWKAEADKKLGPLPEGHAPWKAMLKDENRPAALKTYFAKLTAADTPGAKMASVYLKRSREIGRQLVAGGVANSAEDVNGVLMNGFFHLYGPINDYV